MTEIDEATAPFVEAEIKEHQVALIRQMVAVGKLGGSMLLVPLRKPVVRGIPQQQPTIQFVQDQSIMRLHCLQTAREPVLRSGRGPIERRPVLHDNRR